jgi:hypothetical protein
MALKSWLSKKLSQVIVDFKYEEHVPSGFLSKGFVHSEVALQNFYIKPDVITDILTPPLTPSVVVKSAYCSSVRFKVPSWINPGKLKRKACVLTIGSVVVELDVNNDNKGDDEPEPIPQQSAESVLVQTVTKGLSFSIEQFVLRLNSKEATVEITVENLKGTSTDRIWKQLTDLRSMLSPSPHAAIAGSMVRTLFKQIDIETISVVVHPNGGYEKQAHRVSERGKLDPKEGIVFIKHLPLVIRTAVAEHMVPQGLTPEERVLTRDPNSGVPLVWEPHKKDVYVRLGEVNIKHSVAEWHDVLIAFSTFVDRDTANGKQSEEQGAEYWEALGLPAPAPVRAPSPDPPDRSERDAAALAKQKKTKGGGRKSSKWGGTADGGNLSSGAAIAPTSITVSRKQLVAFYELYDERLKVASTLN